MNSEPYTVIGVLAPDFYHPLPTDLYVPWPIAQLRAKARVDHDFGVIGRLKPGVTMAQAQAELEHHRTPHRCADAPLGLLGR